MVGFFFFGLFCFLHFPMTYYETDGGGRREEVVPDVTLTIQSDDGNGDYVKLRANADDGSPPGAAAELSPPTLRAAVWYWVKLVVLFLAEAYWWGTVC